MLQSAFTLIDHADTLQFARRNDGQIRRASELVGVAEADDLVVRAARLLQREAGTVYGCEISVKKLIPMGGGLAIAWSAEARSSML